MHPLGASHNAKRYYIIPHYENFAVISRCGMAELDG